MNAEAKLRLSVKNKIDKILDSKGRLFGTSEFGRRNINLKILTQFINAFYELLFNKYYELILRSKKEANSMIGGTNFPKFLNNYLGAK